MNHDSSAIIYRVMTSCSFTHRLLFEATVLPWKGIFKKISTNVHLNETKCRVKEP